MYLLFILQGRLFLSLFFFMRFFLYFFDVGSSFLVSRSSIFSFFSLEFSSGILKKNFKSFSFDVGSSFSVSRSSISSSFSLEVNSGILDIYSNFLKLVLLVQISGILIFISSVRVPWRFGIFFLSIFFFFSL